MPCWPSAEVQELRARKIGHVVVDARSTVRGRRTSAAWAGKRVPFAERYPVATKRVVRAVLKAADIFSSDPERSCAFLVDQGYSGEYDYAAEAVREIPYGRGANTIEDTVRFFALSCTRRG